MLEICDLRLRLEVAIHQKNRYKVPDLPLSADFQPLQRLLPSIKPQPFP